MPDMSVNEAIIWLKELREGDYINDEKAQKHIHSILDKLQLFSQMESGGVKKLLPEIRVTQLDEVSFNKGRIVGFNSAIDLCNADLLRKLEGVEIRKSLADIKHSRVVTNRSDTKLIMAWDFEIIQAITALFTRREK